MTKPTTEPQSATTWKNALPDWLTLRCEDGSAIVVPEGTSKLDGLLELLVAEYGVPAFPPENPVICAALERTYANVWRYVLADQRDAEGVEEGCFSADGAGKRAIRVVWYPDSIYELGEQAKDAEDSA